MAYNPNMYYPQPMAAPMTVQSNWMYQPTQTATHMSFQQPYDARIKVKGRKGAEAFWMPPNSHAILFDEDEDTFFYKHTDAAGYGTVTDFGFYPKEPIEAKVASVESVTREEFDELAAKVAALAPKPRTRKAANDGE